jgi:hypothetical protein
MDVERRNAQSGAAHLERLRRACLGLPGVFEKLAWGAPTFRVGRAGKLFAMFADHHHGDPRVAAWCHAPLGKQAVLVASEPERYFRPPYVGPSGWIGLDLARVGDAELCRHVQEAYLQVASAKLARELSGDPPPARPRTRTGPPKPRTRKRS